MHGICPLAIRSLGCWLLVGLVGVVAAEEPTVQELLDRLKPRSAVVASYSSASPRTPVSGNTARRDVVPVQLNAVIATAPTTGGSTSDDQVHQRAAQLWNVPTTQATHAAAPFDAGLWTVDPNASTALRLLNQSNTNSAPDTLRALANVAYPQSSAPLDWDPTHPPSAQRYLEALRKAKNASQPQTRSRVSKAHAHVDYALDLMRRGAVNSAHDEFIEALWSVAYANGALLKELRPVDSLGLALQSLDEADQFASLMRVPDSSVEVRRLATKHQSPAARRVVRDNLNAVAAMQEYYESAQSGLVEALAGDGAGAEALYGLARTIQLRAQNGMTTTALAGPRSMALLLAAHEVAPDDYKISNELGVTYARFGELAKSEKMLKRSLLAKEHAESWHNLSRVWQMVGKSELAVYAGQRADQLKSAGASSTAQNLRMVATQELVANSPAESELPAPKISDIRTVNTPTTSTKVEKTSWLQNMFSTSVFK